MQNFRHMLARWLASPFKTQSNVAVPTPSRSRPAPGGPPAPFTIPVLVVSYFPMRNGRIDRAVTGDVEGSLEQLRRHTAHTTAQVVAALTQGSTYHGYKNARAQPSLHYEIVESVEFLEPLPTWQKPGHREPMTDYNAIMARVDVAEWVMRRGIKEIWIWGYHGGVIDLWESNMAGPFGDISNSDRDAHDLPVLEQTYTVYHYNYQRGPSEAVEDHIHQIEAVLRHVEPHLFWEKFVGGHTGDRCGWAHFPPNGERDYDWRNPKQVWTDIEDWQPEGFGQKQLMGCERWHGDSLQWFIYWMQNLPGADNGLTYGGHPLENWWRYIGDFDAAMQERAGRG